MHVIVYCSRYVGARDQVNYELRQIQAASRRNNRKVDVSGVLFFHQGFFLQILEGEKVALETLMAKILRDPRHADIERLVDSPTQERAFGEWTMDSFHLDQRSDLDPNELQLIGERFRRTFKLSASPMVGFYKAIMWAQEHQRASLHLC